MAWLPTYAGASRWRMPLCPKARVTLRRLPGTQANNAVVREVGTLRTGEKLYNHVDLVQLLDIVNLEAGAWL
jgi:hypothetical protein